MDLELGGCKVAMSSYPASEYLDRGPIPIADFFNLMGGPYDTEGTPALKIEEWEEVPFTEEKDKLVSSFLCASFTCHSDRSSVTANLLDPTRKG